MAEAATRTADGTRAPTEQVPALTKRAFAYLRVSSDGQVQTGYSRDGLSIDAQREEAERKATQLSATIERFFLDPGKSAFVDLHRRTDFLAMLEELKRCNEQEATRIDYVIVWATSRWARDLRVHFDAHDLVKAAGARLVSITEPMVGDDTPEAFYMEGMFALNNQYESMKTGRNVKSGQYQKAKAGGTYGGYRIGYTRSLETLPDGRQVSAVVPDPKRADLITAAFELYASGDYALSSLSDDLYRFGLRTLPTRRWTERKVGVSALQRILRNPYYAGWIVYGRGTAHEEFFDGRHQPLIDRDTFGRVQQLLDEKRIAGERPQIHRHYLKGSVFCGDCGKRLAFGHSTGKSGARYPYFLCNSRINRTPCEMRRSLPPHLIEQAIERYYRERPVELTTAEVAKRTDAIEGLVAVSQQAVLQVKAAKTALIAKLKEQQVRLIRLHAEEGDDVSPDAFRAERARLQAEIHEAEQSLAETEARLQLDADMLRMALELAEDVAAVYAQADEATKRGYNQAFFTKLYVEPVSEDDHGTLAVRVSRAELTEPYAALLAKNLVPELLSEVEAIRAQATRTEGDPYEPPSAGVCSNFVKLAEGTGFEPVGDDEPPEHFAGVPRPPHRVPLRKRWYVRDESSGTVLGVGAVALYSGSASISRSSASSTSWRLGTGISTGSSGFPVSGSVP